VFQAFAVSGLLSAFAAESEQDSMVFTWFGLLFIVLIATVAAYSYKTSRRLALPLNADVVVLDKNVGQQAARGKFWIAVLYLTGVGALLAWFGFIGVFEHFDASRPTTPDSVTGRIIPQSNHGHIVYLTEREEGLLLSLQRTSIGFVFVSVLATYFYKRATGKMPS
jgi:hypothetical protein